MSWDVSILRTHALRGPDVREENCRPYRLAQTIALLRQHFPELGDIRDDDKILCYAGEGATLECWVPADGEQLIHLVIFGDEPKQFIQKLCRVFGGKALDYSSGEFLDYDDPDFVSSHQTYKAFSNEIKKGGKTDGS